MNPLAQEKLLEARIMNLSRLSSDHHLILFHSTMTNPPFKENRPFRFQAAWLTHQDFDNVFSLA